MESAGRKQPLRRSTRVTECLDAIESTSNKLSLASNRKRAAQVPMEESLKKRKARDPTEEPPKKKRSHKARPPLEHYRLKKLDLPFGSNAVTLREKIKREFAHLLQCDEPLIANKAQGVNTQRAQVNQVWEQRYLEFLIFSKEYGHKHVPKMYVDNPELGRWTVKMRRWRKEKDEKLTKSRFKRLEAAGFIWDPKADPDFWKIQNENEKALDLWEDNYNDLLEYEEEHGDCNVPKTFSSNERLSRWVAKQRRHYRAKQANEYHSLTDEKEKRLLDIGFVFNTKASDLLRQQALKHSEDRWDGFCKRLAAFKEEYGHCAVPRRWKRDEQLASWVKRQRLQWKNKQMGERSYLSDERIEQLTEIGFVFGAIDRKIYPADGFTHSTPKTSALWSKAFILYGDESEDDEDGVSHPDKQQQAIAVAPPVKRGTVKTRANIETAKKTTRKARSPDEAAGVSQEMEQLSEAAEAPSGKRDILKSITDNAETRAITRASTTKASVTVERSSKVNAPDESGVFQGKRNWQTTVVAPSGSRGNPKTHPKAAAQMMTTRRTRTSVLAEATLNDEEPYRIGVSLRGEEFQQTDAAALDKHDCPKNNAIDAAKTKTSVSAEESSSEKDFGGSKDFRRKEQPQKTVMAPPGGLGIIISNRTKSKGTVVSDVRTASVLRGKISPGDRIIAIDGDDVSLMTASEISELMASKVGIEKKLTVINSVPKKKEGKGTS